MLRNIIFSEEQIRDRVRAVAREVSNDFVGKDIVLVGLLNGAVHFLSDLNREIERIRLTGEGVASCVIDFMRVGSYGGDRESSGRVKLEMDMQRSPSGKNVIVVDEIAETLHTTEFVASHIAHKGPVSLRTCVLISKPDAVGRRRDIPLHYVGFDQTDLPFLKGYGLDDDQCERGLPFIQECSVATSE
jgi:hypoxanthine phosphoribosyltransferase